MDDEEALLWEKSRRKRDLDNIDKEVPCKKLATETNIEESSPSTSKESDVLDKASIFNENPGGLDKERLKEDLENEKNFTNEEIHAKLKAFDPVMAARLHPNNRRKVLR